MSKILLDSLIVILQILIGFGLINVWLLRFGRETRYRGGVARNMREEFVVYGLPVWFMYVVGFCKIVIALVMITGVFVPVIMHTLGLPALSILCVLMLGALTMHIKVKDSFIKTMPALGMLMMALLVIYLVSCVN